MVTQLKLFDIPFARNSETSRRAAEHIAGKTPTLRTKILDWIRDQGAWGATREEIEIELHIDGNTVRPRVAELLRMHAIFVAPEATRPTLAGLQAEILVAL